MTLEQAREKASEVSSYLLDHVNGPLQTASGSEDVRDLLDELANAEEAAEETLGKIRALRRRAQRIENDSNPRHSAP